MRMRAHKTRIGRAVIVGRKGKIVTVDCSLRMRFRSNLADIEVMKIVAALGSFSYGLQRALGDERR